MNEAQNYFHNSIISEFMDFQHHDLILNGIQDIVRFYIFQVPLNVTRKWDKGYKISHRYSTLCKSSTSLCNIWAMNAASVRRYFLHHINIWVGKGGMESGVFLLSRGHNLITRSLFETEGRWNLIRPTAGVAVFGMLFPLVHHQALCYSP